jgi:hypothetical protein
MASRGNWLAASSLPLFLLGGCQEEVAVRITQSPRSVVFMADPYRKSFDSCIDRVAVYAQETSGERRTWYASKALGEQRCTKSVRYGVAPPNFSADPAPPLRTGVRYRVALTGPGFTATATFART